MPRAEIATKQAQFTLEQLHAELGGKILDNKREAASLAQAMRHVEAVLKLLQPGYNVRGIAVRRRKRNPWFKRGTLFRSAVDTLRRAQEPMTARQIACALLAAKGITATPGQLRDIQGSIQVSLRNNKGGTVVAVGEGMPARWALKTSFESSD